MFYEVLYLRYVLSNFCKSLIKFSKFHFINLSHECYFKHDVRSFFLFSRALQIEHYLQSVFYYNSEFTDDSITT